MTLAMNKRYQREKIMENTPLRTPLRKTVVNIGERKKRHGCLTSCLIMMIVGSAIFIFLYIARAIYPQYSPDLPVWAVPVLVTVQAFEIICLIALFNWKKWGFWFFCAFGGIAVIINILLGVGVTAFGTLISVAILYGVLNIGGENKGWVQLY